MISIFDLCPEPSAGSYLHAAVVQRDERGEQIQVACREHKSKENLALPRNTFKKKIGDIHYICADTAALFTEQRHLLDIA